MSEHKEFQMNPIDEPLKETISFEREAEYFQPKLVGFWMRFWAYSIDLIVISALGGLLIKPIFRGFGLTISDPPFLFFTPFKITMLIVLLLYFLFMTKYLQQTIGKMIVGIKVVSKTGKDLTWGTLIFREVIGRFVSKTLVFPYLFVVFMPKKEALHDIFADTCVVYENAYERKETHQILSAKRSEQLQERSLV